MTQITKQQFEAQLQQIFRMLLEAKTNEEIAKDLQISVRTVQRYKQRLEKRYGNFQRQKTDNTIFLECQLFKNRLITLYKIAEEKARNPNTNGADTAKIIDVAANLAIDVLKIETEGIKAVINNNNNNSLGNGKGTQKNGSQIDSNNQQQKDSNNDDEEEDGLEDSNSIRSEEEEQQQGSVDTERANSDKSATFSNMVSRDMDESEKAC